MAAMPSYLPMSNPRVGDNCYIFDVTFHARRLALIMLYSKEARRFFRDITTNTDGTRHPLSRRIMIYLAFLRTKNKKVK